MQQNKTKANIGGQKKHTKARKCQSQFVNHHLNLPGHLFYRVAYPYGSTPNATYYSHVCCITLSSIEAYLATSICCLSSLLVCRLTTLGLSSLIWHLFLEVRAAGSSGNKSSTGIVISSIRIISGVGVIIFISS